MGLDGLPAGQGQRADKNRWRPWSARYSRLSRRSGILRYEQLRTMRHSRQRHLTVILTEPADLVRLGVARPTVWPSFCRDWRPPRRRCVTCYWKCSTPSLKKERILRKEKKKTKNIYCCHPLPPLGIIVTS